MTKTAKRLPGHTELVCRASVTVSDYMKQAVESIDQKFGAGYATANPELVAAFIQAASMDYLAAVLHDHIVPALDSINAPSAM